MKGYSIPPQLDGEINQLEKLIEKFKRGEITAVEVKAHRVPFGVYEQRESDTYMMRIRCVAGMISPLQLEKVAGIATQYGIRDIHITTRQELQIHYVKLEYLVAMIRQLKEIGLATRGGGGNTVRNIVAQEDAGINPLEEFDVSPYALALTSRMIAESDSWNLPRKFKIAFSGSSEDKGYATIADVGFIAKIKDGKKGFKVYAAGGLGAKSEVGKLLLEFIGADEVFAVTKALKNVFFKYGNRKNKHAARLRFLWQSLGDEEFRKKFQEEYKKNKQDEVLPLVIEEIESEGVSDKLLPEEPESVSDFTLWKGRYVKTQKQADFVSIMIPVELGFISSDQARKLGHFLAPFGDNVLRMTKNQNFLLRNIPKKYLGNIYNFLKDIFHGISRPTIYGKILSCAGAATCQLGICLSRQAAKAVMKDLGESGLNLDDAGDIKINISGCPNCCGQHLAADLGFSGKALRKEGRLYAAYNVFAGAVIYDGRTKFAEHVGEIAAKHMPAFVKDFLNIYLFKTKQYKNIQEYLLREGTKELKKLCLHYKGIPGFEEDKNFYFDWDADSLFSLAERRAGECSAGFFDLIQVDLNHIHETRKILAAEQTGETEKKKLLYDLIFYSCRMLLITRGIEPKNESEVFETFQKHFIDTGFIAVAFKELMTLALHKNYQTLLDRENDVSRFSKDVEALYENMDNSFNFKRPAPEFVTHESERVVSSKEKAADRPAVLKDLRGVVCPLNFVKTKIELSKLKPGDILEIWLDDGEPIENVPGSVKAEGHEIVERKKIGDHWSVIIEKKVT